MRMTRHEDGWIYGLFCTERKDPAAPSGDTSSAVAACGIARTKNLTDWERLSDLKTGSAQQRNVVLHPEFIHGKYALYTRPQDGFIETGKGGGIGFGYTDSMENAIVTEESLMECKEYHTIKEVKNGQGPSPIKTGKGWIHIAHGVRNTAAGLRYVVYAFLSDLEKPEIVTHRPGGFLIAPEGEERIGDVSNVIFCNGAVARENGDVFIYYASSDTRCHLAPHYGRQAARLLPQHTRGSAFLARLRAGTAEAGGQKSGTHPLRKSLIGLTRPGISKTDWDIRPQPCRTGMFGKGLAGLEGKNMAPLSTQSEVPPGRFRSSLFFLFWLAFVLSGIRPFDPIIWIWMSLPPVLAVMILFGFRQRFLPSKATAAAIFLQCLLLLAGAHFSFHAIPFFRITLPNGLERGYLDWIVHGLDGIVYVLLARDLFRKFIPVTPNPLFQGSLRSCARSESPPCGN